MDNIIILAGGTASRFGGKNKALVGINNKPLILYTCEQVKNRGNIYIATNISAIENICREGGYQVFHPECTDNMLHTIKSTYELWQERTIILYSDTIYSSKMINMICELNKFAFVFSKGVSESVAIVLVKKYNDLFLNNINKIIDVEGIDRGPGPKLYKSIKREERIDDIAAFVPENDYTRDFDYQHEYSTFKREFIDKNLLQGD